MREALLLVVSLAATVVCAQSNAPQAVAPPSFGVVAPGGAGMAPSIHFKADGPLTRTLIVPATKMLAGNPDAEIDPKIVVHPSESALGEQQRGTLVAHNLYPGLEFKRIDEPAPAAIQIPRAWPDRRIENTPITWPDAKNVPVKAPDTKAAGKQ